MKEKTVIDFVMVWVDEKDEKWEQQKNKYLAESMKAEAEGAMDAGRNRYRSWDDLQYWFRGVEKYAPWVHKIYFVTCGQKPSWLNEKHPKLVLVNHEEIIPKEYLPTFNSSAIEIYLHRIPGLSEHFVLFNDDIFLTKPIKPELFFRNGLPVDMFMEYPVACYGKNTVMSHVFLNNFNCIGKYHTRREIRKNLKWKILNPRYGKGFFYNLLFYFLPFPNFFGVINFHFACPHLRSSFEEMWEKERPVLDRTGRSRFRSETDVTEYLFRLKWLLDGNFYPANRMKMGKFYHARAYKKGMFKEIISRKYPMICMADDVSDERFEEVKDAFNAALESILPEKSGFER